MNDLRQKTVTGFVWSLIHQTGRQVLMVLFTVLLARLLSPREFGLVGLVTVFTGFAKVFADFGLGAALIHKQETDPVCLSSVFWLNCAIGAGLTLLFVVGAPVLGRFYGEPLLFYLAIGISFNLLIYSVSIVHRSQWTRKMAFKSLALVEICAVGVGGMTAILAASLGLGVWSLVLQSLITSSITVVLFWTFDAWRPRWAFDWSAISGLAKFSLNYMGTKSMNYWVRNLDKLLIGRFLGSATLGLYNISYNVLLLPVNNVAGAMSGVLFPSMSMIKDEKERVKSLYLKVIRAIALVTFPAMMGLFVLAHSLVLALLGESWGGAIDILRVFCILGMTQSLVSLNGSLYLSQGRADLQFKVGFFLRINIIIGIVLGLRWGAIGVALGYAAASMINFYPNIYFSGREIGLTAYDYVKNLSDIFLCALLMAGCVWFAGLYLPWNWSHWAFLLVQIPLAVTVYLLLIHIFKVKAYVDIKDLIRSQLQQSYGTPSVTC